MKDGNLVCPYHGWEYNSEGTCTKIPQLPDERAIPLKAKAIKYTCRAEYGFVWINFENNNPEFPSYPEFMDNSYRNVLWGPQEVNANPPRIVENFLDVGHLSFIHEGFLGVPEYPEIGDYDVHTEGKRIFSDEIAIFQPDPDGTGIAKNVYYTYEIIQPLSVRFTKRDPETDNKMTIMLIIKPIAEGKSVAYGIMSVNYETGTSDQEMIDFQDMIFSQDKPIVENQKPEDLPLDLQVELSLKCDRMSIAYRKYLKKLGVRLGTE